MDKKSYKGQKEKYFSELSNVKNMHDTLIPEEFPEGTYGSPINEHSMVEGKSTESEEGQQRASAFKYINKLTHDDRTRNGPVADDSLRDE